MNTGQIKTQEQNGVVVFVVAGYFEGNAGKQLKAFVDERVRGGKLRFVLDLSECRVINSLGVAAVLEVSASTAEGEIMGVRHRELAMDGVQFHPESILTPDGPTIMGNFLATRGGRRDATARGVP